MDLVERRIDDIPVLLAVPERRTGPPVLWLTHLGGSARQTAPMLERFAGLGHPAVSFDPVRHGARGDGGDPWAFASAVLGSFRRAMWPILGQTVLEAMRVIDWVLQETGQQETGSQQQGTVVAGGVSMGGDVAIALAGIDDRISRVAALGSTPNWDRPGMRSLTDADQLVDQGVADRYAQFYADRLDPGRHPERYLREVAVAVELGAEDAHIPAANALDFRAELVRRRPDAADRIRITVWPGLDHRGITTDEGALAAAAAFLVAPSAPSGAPGTPAVG